MDLMARSMRSPISQWHHSDSTELYTCCPPSPSVATAGSECGAADVPENGEEIFGMMGVIVMTVPIKIVTIKAVD